MRIRIEDGLHPEDNAMLQALYSRSAASVDTHLAKLRESGSGKFMERYYIGYGHKSIGDCGTTTLFIEGVSLLAAKAIQNYPLYNGQETSTRYVDMLQQPIIDPIGSPDSKTILAGWMQLYSDLQTPVELHVRAQHPKRDGEKDEDYDKAVRARTYDICRGFLPAGITTNLSWHVNLRQLGDRLNILLHHPTAEVRNIASAIFSQAFGARYPHSMPRVTDDGDGEHAYRRHVANDYYLPTRRAWPWSTVETMGVGEAIDPLGESDRRFFELRPPRCELPAWLAERGTMTFRFLLDFGSFRDLQRHRNGICRMPLVAFNHGLHPWYLERLPLAIIDDVRQRLVQLYNLTNHVTVDLMSTTRTIPDGMGANLQYYQPLATLVPCSVTYGLPGLVYMLELRTGKMVHPTLRARALAIADWFESRFNLRLHVDRDPDDWDVRRGRQDITER